MCEENMDDCYIRVVTSPDQCKLTITVLNPNLEQVTQTTHDISDFLSTPITFVTRQYVYILADMVVAVYNAINPTGWKRMMVPQHIVILSIVSFANKFGLMTYGRVLVYDSATLSLCHNIEFNMRYSCIAPWGDDTYILVMRTPGDPCADVIIQSLTDHTLSCEGLMRVGVMAGTTIMESGRMHGFGNIHRIGKYLVDEDSLEIRTVCFDRFEFHGGLISVPKEDGIDLSLFHFFKTEGFADDPTRDYWAIPCRNAAIAEMLTIDVPIETV